MLNVKIKGLLLSDSDYKKDEGGIGGSGMYR